MMYLMRYVAAVYISGIMILTVGDKNVTYTITDPTCNITVMLTAQL